MLPEAMGTDGRAGFAARHRFAAALVSALVAVCVAVGLTTEFSARGSLEGLYLLRGLRKPFEVRTDLFLDEEHRVIAALPLASSWRWIRGFGREPSRALPYLEYTWNSASGDGYVISHLAKQTLLVINWSRFLDDQRLAPSGLFLGGSLPYALNPSAAKTQSDTGMAYFDGRRWYHGWCSINEVLAHGSDPKKKIYPSAWEFLGSSVLEASPSHLLITSKHRAQVEGVPVAIQKWAFLKAGDLHFTLATRIENVGSKPTAYYYLYGDEPWVGSYGSSLGNVGWIRTGLVYHEGFVNPASTDFVGYYDGGNRVIGERGPFTHTANFLQWFGPEVPSAVFFTNMERPLQPPWNTVPLASSQGRALFLQWGAQTLPPGGVKTYLVAMGIIPARPGRLRPVKPAVVLDPRLLKRLVAYPSAARVVVPDAVPEESAVVVAP